MLLQKGQSSPYYGVLMPIDYAKALEQKSLDLELYKVELKKHETDIPLYKAPDSSTIVLVGIGGVLIGFLIGALAR
jgi:hypothetical protein